jgi:hypothetical protein
MLLIMPFHFVNCIILRYLQQQTNAAVVPQAGLPMVHPGGDALNVNAAGFKIWGGTSWPGHSKIDFTEWLQGNADEPQMCFIFNRKAEFLNPRIANAIFMVSRGFPVITLCTQAAGAPAGRGQGVSAMKPWLENYVMEGVERVNIVVKREEITQAEALTFPIGDPANLGGAGMYPVGVGTGLQPNYNDLPTESDYECWDRCCQQ